MLHITHEKETAMQVKLNIVCCPTVCEVWNLGKTDEKHNCDRKIQKKEKKRKEKKRKEKKRKEKKRKEKERKGKKSKEKEKRKEKKAQAAFSSAECFVKLSQGRFFEANTQKLKNDVCECVRETKNEKRKMGTHKKGKCHTVEQL